MESGLFRTYIAHTLPVQQSDVGLCRGDVSRRKAKRKEGQGRRVVQGFGLTSFHGDESPSMAHPRFLVYVPAVLLGARQCSIASSLLHKLLLNHRTMDWLRYSALRWLRWQASCCAFAESDTGYREG
eukprot:3789449-Rhodomonas_salina.3